MTCQLLTPLRVRTPKGIKKLQVGEVIVLPEDMARPLLAQGRIKQLVPHFNRDGDIAIPFDADSRFYWWQHGGQSVEETEEEVRRILH